MEQEGKPRDKTTNQHHSKPSSEEQTSQPKQVLEEPHLELQPPTAQGSWHSVAKAAASAKGGIKPTQGLASHYKLEESRKSTKRSEFRIQKKSWEKPWGWGFPEELHWYMPGISLSRGRG